MSLSKKVDSLCFAAISVYTSIACLNANVNVNLNVNAVAATLHPQWEMHNLSLSNETKVQYYTYYKLLVGLVKRLDKIFISQIDPDNCQSWWPKFG